MSSSARSRLAIALTATLALVTTATLTTTTLAHATPQSDLASEQQRAAQLASQIEANGNRVSVLDEEFNAAQLAIDKATEKIHADEKSVAEKQRQTDAVREQLTARGAELYIGAGNPAPLAGLDVSNARELGTRSAYAGAAADQDRQLLDQVKVAIDQLGLEQASLHKARSAAVKQRDQLDEKRKEITRAAEEQQSLLAQTQGKIKSLVDEIQAEKAAAAEAAARASLEHAQALAQARAVQEAQQQAHSSSDGSGTSNNSGSNSGSTSGSNSSSGTDPNVPAAGPQAQVAVDFAKAQLGKPYEYAGAGPNTFDCSGLTMMAWGAAGVGISHNAEAQYQSLPHVSMDQLEPGDLVFFGSPIHHVGIFVGGGTMIEAPYTGVDVRYHTIYRSDFAGAARP